MKEKFSLKDHLFNEEKVKKIAFEIAAVYPSFQAKEFIKETVRKFPQLELKERIVWIRECLHVYLPQEYRKAVKILLDALPAPLDPNKTDNDFGQFIYAPYLDFLAAYGLQKKDVKFSLKALKEMTKRFSAEDAIRYFINTYPEETLAELTLWSQDAHYHVRRLCSEGTRPKLPWSQKIILPPGTAIKILENLYTDSTRYVTRSVANHLNDISKTHPEIVLRILKKWNKSKKQKPEEMGYITKHALRTLLKGGNAEALALLGFTETKGFVVRELVVHTQKVKRGSALEFSFSVDASQAVKLLIDYTVFFRGKNGTLSNKKIHKLTQLKLSAGETKKITKKHPLRADMTTRTLYPGIHRVEVQINGRVYSTFEFELF